MFKVFAYLKDYTHRIKMYVMGILILCAAAISFEVISSALRKPAFVF